MSDYKQFIFKDYLFNESSKVLELHYSIDNIIDFKESYKFDFNFVDYSKDALDRSFQNLFFMAGVSYFKTYIPTEIVIEKGTLDRSSAEFFSKTYQKGLGEFWYINNLDPKTPVNFPSNIEEISAISIASEGIIIGVGGGKDSLVSIELIRKDFSNINTWSVNHRSQLEPLVNKIGLDHLWVEREWDPKLSELAKQGALNGHVPISAIFACVGTIVSILSGRRDSVVSNEQSANEPTLNFMGTDINHQYSKSQEFEEDYQSLLKKHFSEGTRYYSYLRPLSELRISEIFSKIGFNKYKEVFSSCNRAYTHDSNKMFWCGECAKCAFVYVAFSPFIDQDELQNLFHGKNLLKDESLDKTYKQLLGIEGDKPLDCVGEIKESRTAMRLTNIKFPESTKYHFEIPEEYSYLSLGSSNMPEEMLDHLTSKIQNL